MKVIFFLVRFPFALVLFVLLTFLLAPLVIVFWLIVLPIWILMQIPFVFLGAAFKNRTEVLSSFLKEQGKDWIIMIPDILGQAYKDLFSWSLHGDEK